MSVDKSSGSAFPCSGYGQWEPQGGMTLRDYFAAKAMQALIEGALASDSDFPLRENVSGRAYAYADAMLAARDVNK